MDNIIFALGPKGRYLFNAPSAWGRGSLPKEVEDPWKANTIADFICATFGEDDTGKDENYFFIWKLKDKPGSIYTCWGDNTPAAFREWLLKPGTQEPKDEHSRVNMNVVLGPKDSFVAWTPDSIRWGGIPSGLERVLQSWLTPAGWKSGPPRLIALGCDNSYFALSEYGAWGYSIGSSWTLASERFPEWAKTAGRDWTDIQYMCLDPVTPDRYVIVYKSTEVKGNKVTNVVDFRRVANSFATDEAKEIYAKEKVKEKSKAEEEAKKKAEQAKAEAARQAAQEEKEAEMQFQYAIWLSVCERAFSSHQPLRIFPQPPEKVCTCVLVACKIRKKDSGLTGCRHDFEPLLKASGNYSVAWLRTERNSWHPDSFGRKCEVSCRKQLQRQAQEVFTIFGELIEESGG